MTATLTTPIAHLKPPPKRYRVGEIVRHTGLSRQTLHNYTAMGLITAAECTPGGHRLYDETVFHRLAQIAELKRSMRMDEMTAVLNDAPQIAG